MNLSQMDLEEEQITLDNIRQLKRLLNSDDVTQADIRIYAGFIRYLLIDHGGGIARSAKKWGVKIEFICPDTKPLVRNASNGYVSFFSASYVVISGVGIGAFRIYDGPHKKTDDGYDLEKCVTLNLESMCKQIVMFGEGKFLTRADVLKYVANKAGGIHWDRTASGPLPEDKMRAFEQIRKETRVSVKDGIPKILVVSPGEPARDEFRYAPDELDLVYVEFYALAYLIFNADSVQLLAQTIESHLVGLGKG